MSTRARASALALAGALTAAAGCSSGSREPPSRLVDGSSARLVAVELEGVDVPIIQTNEEAAGRLRCRDELDPGDRGVERIGAIGSSVTVASASGRFLRACDSVRPGEWCGQAFARLRHARALDPRLSLTCSDTDGDPVGFGWIEPGTDAAYVVVTHDGYAEAYRTRGSIPVRVTSERVDVVRSSARFAVSEHDESGRLLREYVSEPQVAD